MPLSPGPIAEAILVTLSSTEAVWPAGTEVVGVGALT